MRIAVHVGGLSIRGSEKQVITLASELMHRGHHVAVSCAKNGPVEKSLRERGIETTSVRPRGDVDFWSALSFARWLRRGRFDALLLTSWKRAFIAGWAGRVARIPRVVLRVGGEHRIATGPRGWKYRRALNHYMDAIMANSSFVADGLKSGMPTATVNRIHIVPNGLKLSSATAAPLRAQLGLAEDALVAAAVGGLEAGKGYRTLLNALAQASDRTLHLAVAGDGPEREALLAQARKLGLADRVHLLGHRNDIPTVLASTDLFISASRSDGFSVAMLEAMAAAKPVVATNVGGVREALSAHDGRGEAGWIVPRDSARALAAALDEVVAGIRAGDARIASRAAEASWRVANWFTVEHMVDGAERLLLARVI